MDYLPTDSILKIRPDAVERVREQVDLHRPGEMEGAVRMLEEWITQQAHYLKKQLPKSYLEATILTNKGSLERAKAMIDKLCTLRTISPDEFRPPDIEQMAKLMDGNAHLLLMPKQTEDHYRINIIRPRVSTPEIMRMFYKACYMLVDYVRMYDYGRGIDVIYDLTHLDVKGALYSINFMEFKNCYEIVNHSYSLRVRYYFVVSSSKWVEPLVNVFKSFMKKKISDRIVVLQHYTDLHKYYPKEILPKEYGGEDASLDEIQAQLMTHLGSSKHKKVMDELFEARTDETKRPAHVFNDLYAGTAGTFRALKID